MEAYLSKIPSGALIPVDEASAEFIAKQKVGQGFRCRLERFRNIGFHRKYFALMNYAFGQWERPEEYAGGFLVQKSFNAFRDEVTIAAGFYEQVFNMDGSFRLDPRSIKFNAMGQEEFEQLYSNSINVLLRQLLTDHSRNDVDRVVNNILHFS